MKNNRLQMVADTLCHTFSTEHYPEIRGLGSGTLGIDLLDESCTFNHSCIPNLRLVSELKSRLKEELLSCAIPFEVITSAQFTVRLQYTPATVRSMNDDKVPSSSGKTTNRCIFSCNSSLKADSTSVRSRYCDVEESTEWRIAS